MDMSDITLVSVSSSHSTGTLLPPYVKVHVLMTCPVRCPNHNRMIIGFMSNITSCL